MKKNMNVLLDNLNLDASAQKKIKQILLVSQKVPVERCLEVVEKNIAKDEYGVTAEKPHLIPTNLFANYKIYKIKSANGDMTNTLGFQVEDKQFLTVGLTYYTVDEISIHNLSHRTVTVKQSAKYNYFSGQVNSHGKEINYFFDKNDDLQTMQVKDIQSQNEKYKATEMSFENDKVQEMLHEAKSNMGDEGSSM